MKVYNDFMSLVFFFGVFYSPLYKGRDKGERGEGEEIEGRKE
jgi:hypothetical protein